MDSPSSAGTNEAAEHEGLWRLPDGSVLFDNAMTPPEKQRSVQFGNPECTLSVYGSPMCPEAATAAHPAGDGGIVWHAQLVPDDWRHPKHCMPDGEIKPRRPNLPVRVSDFFKSLVQGTDGRWIFSGVLNGWPGLTCLELRAITRKEGMNVKRLWEADRSSAPPPQVSGNSVRLTLRMPPWSARGWTKDSKGYVFWYFSQRSGGPKTDIGENMRIRLKSDLEAEGQSMPHAVNIHLFAHRYALGKGKRETTKDRLTYHSAILIEWDHGLYTTVVELAILNAVGGYRGRANWHEDRDEPCPTLYASLPAVTILPWINELAEIRAQDVPARNVKEFQEFLQSYTGPEKRFLDPQVQHSGPVRLRHRSQEDIMIYLLNYIQRDRRYTEKFRNCQAFAADLYGFLAGKKDIEPFGMVTRRTYKQRSHLFLYEPDMYDGKDEEADQ